MTRGAPARACAVTTAAALALALAGCGGGTSPGARAAPTASRAGITVFAAASLTEVFTALGERFEATHPGARVTFSFGPSSGLAQQIAQGAPADVFASASPRSMQQVTDAGQATRPEQFARNVMQIAVPPPDPAGISSLADLARPGVKVVLCQVQVPCGSVAARVLANAGVAVTPVSQEADVRAVLSKVALGEADAGIVYVTDVRAAAGEVRGVEIPADVNASTSYPITVLKASRNASAARAFVDLVLSADGRSALAAAGFQAP